MARTSTPVVPWWSVRDGHAEPGAERLPWLRALVVATLLLNLFDLLFTVYWLNSGLAIEANPLMEIAADVGAIPFALAKLTLVSLGIYLLWMRRDRLLAVAGVCTVFVAYAAVFVHHLRAIEALATRSGVLPAG